MADTTKDPKTNETMKHEQAKGSVDPNRQQQQQQEFGKDREKSAIGGQAGETSGQQQQNPELNKDKERSEFDKNPSEPTSR